MDINQKEIVKILNRRLAESAKFWYQCIDEYQDINEFLSSLNALIQSLRNVTFIIQKHKHKIPYFDDWYSSKQEIMKHDQYMKWLVKARNQVVKQGDLKINSVAEASIRNWLEYELFTFQVDPLSNNDTVISSVLSALRIKEIVAKLREPILQIERTWRVDQFPNKEILEILSYCYKQLKSIIGDLYLQIGINELSKVEYIEQDESLILGVVSSKARTTCIDLKNGSILQLNVESHRIPKKYVGKALERYGPEKIFVKCDIKNIYDPFSSLKVFLEKSMTILKKDGCHAPMVHFFFKDRHPVIHLIPTYDKTQQYYLIRQIAEDIIRQSVTGLIFILEQWIYPLDKPADRGECLMVACIRNDGKFEAHITPFFREKGSTILEPSRIDYDLKSQNWLRPIVKAWNIKT